MAAQRAREARVQLTRWQREAHATLRLESWRDRSALDANAGIAANVEHETSRAAGELLGRRALRDELAQLGGRELLAGDLEPHDEPATFTPARAAPAARAGEQRAGTAARAAELGLRLRRLRGWLCRGRSPLSMVIAAPAALVVAVAVAAALVAAIGMAVGLVAAIGVSLALLVAGLGNDTMVVTDIVDATRVRPQRCDDRSIVMKTAPRRARNAGARSRRRRRG